MNFTENGRDYVLIRASDSERDGMGMELHVAGQTKVLAEVFYFNTTREFSISLFEKELPLPVIEKLIGMAKVALVPATRVHDR